MWIKEVEGSTSFNLLKGQGHEQFILLLFWILLLVLQSCLRNKKWLNKNGS